jgi:16S rRNA (guanine966-N2)-methyltransferase
VANQTTRSADGTVQRVTRIIAGAYGGRRLQAPPGRDTRPTSDRVREALFGTLESLVDLAGTRFADLYAGSGAVGLEALSRGASHVLLVEAEPKAARAARENVRALGAGDAVRLAIDRVERFLTGAPAAGSREPYDVVFADPPYALPDRQVGEMLTALVAGGWLAEEAVVVVERSSRGVPLVWVDGLVPVFTDASGRRYGETTLWYGRRS